MFNQKQSETRSFQRVWNDSSIIRRIR